MQQELSRALGFLQRGHRQQAKEIAQTLLTRNPNDANVLHLLGVVHLQEGDLVRAAERISRAIANNPLVAAFHSNLAVAYRGLGELNRALECCHAALRLQPHYPAAYNSMGLTLLALGRADQAVASFQEATRLEPGLAAAHNNLGDAFRQLGNLARAVESYRQALHLAPSLAPAHSNLGQLLLESGQPARALDHCLEAVRLDPRLAQARNNLGNVLCELGRMDEARANYLEALRLVPREASTHNNMGRAFEEEGRFEEAITWYRRALELDPNSPRVLADLASALVEQELYEEALSRYEQALRLSPKDVEALNGLGRLLGRMGRSEEARTKYQEALALKADFAVALCNLGMVLAELGDLAGAEAAFWSARRHDPRNTTAAEELAILLKRRLPDDELDSICRMLSDPTIPATRHAPLHYGLAQAYDARGVHDKAASHLRQANDLRRSDLQRLGKSHDPARHSRFIDELVATFTPELFERTRGFGLDSDLPVFVFGLPRSGTTLIEQVLASHSRVFGAGELRFTHDSLEWLGGRVRNATNLRECMERLDRETAAHIAGQQLARLRSLNDQASRIVDKMPDNFVCLGLISILFPRAKLIHCRRDLRDVALSCWMTRFRGMPWACDQDHMAAYFADYLRIMNHWRAVLPLGMLEVSYEETVANLEGVARRLLAWCGLEWEPACLEFHRTNRPVRTASVAQVRQPLYSDSVARWKRYEPYLGDLFARLPADSPHIGA